MPFVEGFPPVIAITLPVKFCTRRCKQAQNSAFGIERATQYLASFQTTPTHGRRLGSLLAAPFSKLMCLRSVHQILCLK